MPIKKPGKRPFSPWLQAHKGLGGAHRKKNIAQDLLLTPLIDMFVILVVFLIMNFSATGDLINITKDIQLPQARSTTALERAPILQISANTVAIEGVGVGNSDDILKDPDLRIPALTDKLQDMRKVDEIVHPGQAFKGQIIINCDKDVDFKLVRKVMFAAANAGYTNFNYAVLQTSLGPSTGEIPSGEAGG